MLRNECIDTSSDEESDETSQLMVDAATILHDHRAKQISVYRGSTKGRFDNLPCNRAGGHARLYKDYFHLTDQGEHVPASLPDVKRTIHSHSTGRHGL
jgi:hypothetical protein